MADPVPLKAKMGGDRTDLDKGNGTAAASNSSASSRTDRRVLYYLCVAGLAVRLLFLYHPSVVVYQSAKFDEVHFGGFASKYISRNYFFDVHPPLAKLLIALSGHFAGLTDFSFRAIGLDYLQNNVPYVAMRLVPAFLGFLLVPMAFVTLRAFRFSTWTSAFVTALLVFENAFVAQSRLILLDAYLLFFTASSLMFYALFHRLNQRKHYSGGVQSQSGTTRPAGEFSLQWWSLLLLTGLCLGAAVSSKWVGLFVIALVGLLVVIDLWNILGDTHIPMASTP